MTAIPSRPSDRTLRTAARVVALSAPAMTVVDAFVVLAEPTLMQSWQQFLGELGWQLVICTFPSSDC